MLEGDTDAILEEMTIIAYYMRGSVDYVDSFYNLTIRERKKMMKFINERLETEFKKPPSQCY